MIYRYTHGVSESVTGEFYGGKIEKPGARPGSQISMLRCKIEA